jgi:hypothetical protein
MDERDAFERQLAAEIERQVGSPRPVDALAVAHAAKATAQRWRIRTMLSATASLATGVAAVAAAVLLLGQPLGQPEPEVPAAPTASPAAAPTMAAPTKSVRSEGTVVTGQAFCVDPCFGTPTACDEALSDPRLSGPGSWSWVWTCPSISEEWPYQPGCVVGGHMTISGPDGSWSGSISGFWDQAARQVSLLATLTGSQGYAGWSFVARYQVGTQGLADVDGVVYQGPPPPSFGR